MVFFIKEKACFQLIFICFFFSFSAVIVDTCKAPHFRPEYMPLTASLGSAGFLPVSPPISAILPTGPLTRANAPFVAPKRPPASPCGDCTSWAPQPWLIFLLESIYFFIFPKFSLGDPVPDATSTRPPEGGAGIYSLSF